MSASVKLRVLVTLTTVTVSFPLLMGLSTARQPSQMFLLGEIHWWKKGNKI